MKTTFKTLNTRMETDGVTVFFEFSNGEINSQKFSVDSTLMDIIGWANERASFFDEREVKLAELQEQIMEENNIPEEQWQS